jgi:hypothetical protein
LHINRLNRFWFRLNRFWDKYDIQNLYLNRFDISMSMLLSWNIKKPISISMFLSWDIKKPLHHLDLIYQSQC